MDKASWIGLILGFVTLVGGMILKGSDPGALINPAALVIIFLGTGAALLIAFPMNEMKKFPKLLKIIFSNDNQTTEKELIPLFTELAYVARRDGLLALEDKTEEVEDEFLKRGLMMIVDGQSKEFIRDLLEEDIDAMADRHTLGSQIFTQAGTYAPTLGVLGAVIGLISALGHLDNMELLGKSIAAAFVATLFGIFSGYVLWHPFANKLKRKSQQEQRIRQIIIEGLVAVQEGVSARVIQDKILTYLPASEREQVLKEIEENDNATPAGESVAANG
jgi:chemotaxis protein MotA